MFVKKTTAYVWYVSKEYTYIIDDDALVRV